MYFQTRNEIRKDYGFPVDDTKEGSDTVQADIGIETGVPETHANIRWSSSEKEKIDKYSQELHDAYFLGKGKVQKRNHKDFFFSSYQAIRPYLNIGNLILVVLILWFFISLARL